MPKCGECRLLLLNPKGDGYRCRGKLCMITKITPDTDASKCKKFKRK